MPWRQAADLSRHGPCEPGPCLSQPSADCAACALKPQCTTARQRAVTRLVTEDARDQVRALANTEAYARSRQQRKRIERVFGHLKRNLNLRARPKIELSDFSGL
ncbi:transposase [Sphingomonas sp. HMP9]|uniref:transposase n=1 Tax=Sphingomonas sp. HMP9 TaxID=1517554 RepID=UPI001E447B96|nr:transposase [Sphingomonas sp. HMP9]